ncbi:MAG TPA: DNA-3-methyladenine glycosylase [Acidothermaceae bacterium]|nr:DNA-3-methyladenine glycosylase [Acidothermaceae bacterium]
MSRTTRLGELLPRAFFARPSVKVAPQLLGCVLEHETDDGLVAVRLTEVEAYHGAHDPGSHAFRGRTARNSVMFGAPGFVYVYFTYGMHYCMNLVCEPAGTASAVLLRAGEVVVGGELATARRAGPAARDLARGPARLTVALGIGRDDNGRDACDPSSSLRVRAGEQARAGVVRSGPRVGLSAGAETPWRFWLDGEPTVSAYRAHVPRRRQPTRQPEGFGA